MEQLRKLAVGVVAQDFKTDHGDEKLRAADGIPPGQQEPEIGGKISEGREGGGGH